MFLFECWHRCLFDKLMQCAPDLYIFLVFFCVCTSCLVNWGLPWVIGIASLYCDGWLSLRVIVDTIDHRVDTAAKVTQGEIGFWFEYFYHWVTKTCSSGYPPLRMHNSNKVWIRSRPTIWNLSSYPTLDIRWTWPVEHSRQVEDVSHQWGNLGMWGKFARIEFLYLAAWSVS